jgi:hypothetical protein
MLIEPSNCSMAKSTRRFTKLIGSYADPLQRAAVIKQRTPSGANSKWAWPSMSRTAPPSIRRVPKLRILVVDADVIGHRITPGAHLGGDHGKIKSTLLTLQCDPHVVFSRDILEAGNSADNPTIFVTKRSHVETRHPALPIRVLDDGFGPLEDFTRKYSPGHGRLLRLERLTLQVFDAEGSEKPLGRIKRAERICPIDEVLAYSHEGDSRLAGTDADRQRVENRLVQIKKRFQKRRLVWHVEVQEGHGNLPRPTWTSHKS